MECSWKVGLRGLTAIAVLLIGGTAVARAQFAGPAMSVASASAGAPAGAMHLDYQDVKIMTGDVISIMTYGAPELSSEAVALTIREISGETINPSVRVRARPSIPRVADSFPSGEPKQGAWLEPHRTNACLTLITRSRLPCADS